MIEVRESPVSRRRLLHNGYTRRMRQYLAFLLLGLVAGGCSWIYNPDSLKKAIDGKDFEDAPVDVEIIADANLAGLELDEVYPTKVYEGAGVTESGTGVGIPALLVIRGHNFAKDPSEHLMVTMTADTGGMITVDDVAIARDGNFIAVTVSAPIDGACHDGSSHNVAITVQQDDGLGGTVMQPLTGLTIACLDELTASPASASALKSRYSKVDITGNLAFPANESPNVIALVHSMSYVKGDGQRHGGCDGCGTWSRWYVSAGRQARHSAVAGGPGAGSGAGGGRAVVAWWDLAVVELGSWWWARPVPATMAARVARSLAISGSRPTRRTPRAVVAAAAAARSV